MTNEIGNVQFGTVLTFKQGLDPKVIAERLSQLEDILDASQKMTAEDYKQYNPKQFAAGTMALAMSKDRAEVVAVVESFNPDYGQPVFYIP